MYSPVTAWWKVQTEKEIAELKITKAVTYKKTPIRVNGTYYIGIFEDAGHKKLLYKKAMSLSNASSMTSTLKINLYKLAEPHTITLYFAETDKNGKVVKSGEKSGYDISIDHDSITLSPTNADASVTVTNNVRQGSVAAVRPGSRYFRGGPVPAHRADGGKKEKEILRGNQKLFFKRGGRRRPPRVHHRIKSPCAEIKNRGNTDITDEYASKQYHRGTVS